MACMMRKSERRAEASAAAQSRADQPLEPPLTATVIERFVDCSAPIVPVVRFVCVHASTVRTGLVSAHHNM
jgi:hypothetical protein